MTVHLTTKGRRVAWALFLASLCWLIYLAGTSPDPCEGLEGKQYSTCIDLHYP